MKTTRILVTAFFLLIITFAKAQAVKDLPDMIKPKRGFVQNIDYAKNYCL
ncbi:hypothetical protein [Flavobacterium sp. 3HN19-14]